VPGLQVLALRGFRATPWLPVNLVLDFLYAIGLRARRRDCDVLVTNSFWAPVILSPFRPRGMAMVVHVARFPKGQMGLYRGADALQAISSAVAREIGRQTPSVRDKVAVLPYPVDLAVFRPPAQGRRESTPFTIAYAGRIHPEKGIHLLVAAFARLHARQATVRLRIIGPHAAGQGGGGDAYLQELRKAAAGAPVEFAGAVRDPRELAAQYAAADCFCYPSQAEKGEAFGLAILEAMATALPVVVSDLDCFRDFVTHGKEGLVFDHRAEDAAARLCEALFALAARPAEALAMGRAAQARAREYELETVAARYIGFFEQVRARRAP
jgi:glycosyltransferase involved in cell wall biosynthesis